MQFDLSRLDPDQCYKLLASTVTPRPIAWVTTINGEGRVNAAPFSFFNVLGEAPPVLGFSTAHRPGSGPKDTEKNIRTIGEFVVNLVNAKTLEAMNITAIEFGPEVDELREAGLTAHASNTVKPPRIAESPVAFECTALEMVPLGPTRTLVLGKIHFMHIQDSAILDAERLYIDQPALGLVGRMQSPNCYIDASHSFELPRILIEKWQGHSDA